MVVAKAFLQIIDSDDRLEDDEIKLGEPDLTEAESLPVHVTKCAKRYRVTIRRINRLDRSVNRATLILLVTLSWVVLSSDKLGKILTYLATL